MDPKEIDTLLGFSDQDTPLPPLLSATEKLNPENYSRVKPFYARTFTKVLVVGGAFGLVSLFIGSLFSGGSDRRRQVAGSDTSPASKALEESLRQAQQENDQLQAQLATQKQEIQPVAPAPQPTVALRRAPQPTPPTRIVRMPPPPPPVYTASRSVSATIPPVPVRAVTPPEDPYHAWERLSRLGSFSGGNGSMRASTTVPAFASPPAPSTTRQSWNRQEIRDSQTLTSAPTSPYPSTNLDRGSSPLLVDSTHVRPGQSIPPGTTARARLISPVVWSDDIKINSHTFLVELREELGSALPEGTIVRIQPEEISQAGLIRFRAVGATLNGQDRSLPAGIQVVAANGSFIKAKVRQQGGPSLATDLFGATLSGVSTAAQLMNQPRTQTSFTNGTFSQTTTTNNNTSMGMGFAQGATETFVNRLEGRTQQRRQHTPYFYVGVGTPVMLMVTQTVAL